jgi:transposase-like protein
VKKTVPILSAVDDDDAPELSAELRLAFEDIAELAREGLLAMSVGVGLRVMVEMMENELTEVVGPKNAKLPDRSASRHASAPGSVALGGRRVPMSRPRARTTGDTEVALDTYATFTNDDLLTRVVLERMLAGVATRRHRAVAEPVGKNVEATARSTGRSSVSRRFKESTAAAMDELMARDLSGLAVAAMMIDGVMFAEACCVVALAICTDGTKVPVGLWLGDTENKTIVTQLLADLVDRGLASEAGLLVVIDGAKALAARVRKVLGDQVLVQRCVLHTLVAALACHVDVAPSCETEEVA